MRGACEGVVLAGGRGRRFGAPKATAPVGGVTLVERAVTALTPRCRRVVVVARPETPLPDLDVPVLHDDPGPPSALVGLLAGLRAVTGHRVAVLGCDVLAAPSLLDRLLDPAHPGNRAAADQHGVQPLCARYERAHALAAAEAQLERGDLRMRALARRLAVTTIAAREGELANINTPADAAAAELALG